MKFLTVFTHADISADHLWKDVGGIPYALAKYRGWTTALAYIGYGQVLHDREYEKYVRLICLEEKTGMSDKKIVGKFIISHAKEYDVIQVYHDTRLCFYVTLLARLVKPGIKIYSKLDLAKEGFDVCINRDRSNLRKRMKRWLNIKLGLIPDLYTVETRAYAEQLAQIKYYNGRVRYLPNGVFHETAREQENKENIFLSVGRLGTYPKNTELLLEAFSLIASKLQQWKLYLVGSTTEEFDRYLGNFLLLHPELRNRIILMGSVHDKRELYDIYAKSKIFVLSSRFESFGLVLTEAMVNGCMPIVTDCCAAFYDIIPDKDCGMIVSNESCEELAYAMEKAASDEAVCLSIGRRAREYVLDCLTWKKQVGTLERYLCGEVEYDNV